MKTSIGALDPPLGNTRLQVTRLLACLLGLNNAEVLREIIRLEMIEVLLDLFFKYVWNNFLHAQVQQCIFAALVAHVEPNESDNETSDNLMYPYVRTFFYKHLKSIESIFRTTISDNLESDV